MKFNTLCEFTENLNTLLNSEPIKRFDSVYELYGVCKNTCDTVSDLALEFNKLLNDNDTWKNWNGLEDHDREKQLAVICQGFYDKHKDNIKHFEWEFFFEVLEDNNYHTSNKILKKLVCQSNKQK